MKLTILSILGFGCLVLMSFTMISDEPRYKNLKVLPKDITKPQLDSVMKHFTASLGVKCNFCHVRNAEDTEWNFPSDDNKHKLVARDMIRMTQKINDKYFDVTGTKKDLNAKLMVTCYTCHNGSKEPLTAPAPKQPRPKAEEQPHH
ncbi:MAG TPA: c-type cytochrome [Flavisolibacter sp.]